MTGMAIAACLASRRNCDGENRPSKSTEGNDITRGETDKTVRHGSGYLEKIRMEPKGRKEMNTAELKAAMDIVNAKADFAHRMVAIYKELETQYLTELMDATGAWQASVEKDKQE